MSREDELNRMWRSHVESKRILEVLWEKQSHLKMLSIARIGLRPCSSKNYGWMINVDSETGITRVVTKAKLSL